MCVIMIVDKLRPTEVMVEKAWQRNDDWGGIAWREPAKDGKGTEVCWKKGIQTVEEMDELIATLPLPFIAHFRIASSGGVKRSLCHPFPVEKNTTLALEGRTKGDVLFHNGDWKGWPEAAREAAILSNTHIPVGHWSDTRAIAWLSAIYGTGFMEFLPEQKGVVFGPQLMDVFTGPGWIKVNDVWCSNDYFMRTTRVVSSSTPHVHHSGKYCSYGNCTREDNLDKDHYCPLHTGGVLKIPQLTSQSLEPGGASAATPFLKAGLIQGGLISIAVAETLHNTNDHHGNRLLSKNLLKKIKRLYAEMEGAVKPQRKEIAKRELLRVTASLITSGRAH